MCSTLQVQYLSSVKIRLHMFFYLVLEFQSTAVSSAVVKSATSCKLGVNDVMAVANMATPIKQFFRDDFCQIILILDHLEYSFIHDYNVFRLFFSYRV